MLGTLYGIGVGPGAPDLLTLRAVHALQRCHVVLCARRQGSSDSLAYSIARPYLPEDSEILPLDFPMTRDRKRLEEAWNTVAETTCVHIQKGADCAFLTLGDPLLYSTFGYLLRKIRETDPAIPVSVIPGITAFQAAMARLGTPLCEQEENLHIISGINSEEVLEQEIRHADTAVILKAYRNFPAIFDALKACGRLEDTILASSVEQEGEHIQQGLHEKEQKTPYMTLLVSRKKKTGTPLCRTDPSGT